MRNVPGDPFLPAGTPHRLRSKPQPQRRKRWVVPTLLGVLLAAYLLFIHPFAYVIELPGPTVNLLQNTRVDGTEKPIVEVADGREHPLTGDGKLRMVTVSVRGGPGTGSVRGWELLRAYFSDKSTILPYDKVFAPDTTAEEENKIQQKFMTSSQDNARAAALTALKIPFTSTITIAQVSKESDGYGKLEPEDRVVALTTNGKREAAKSTADLYRVLEATAPGTEIVVEVDRKGKTVEIPMKTLAPQQPGQKGSLLGAFITADYTFPYPISVNVPESIGGPSAGTVFALTMMNALSNGDLVGDKDIAVTGTISPNGLVGPIGGVVQKIYGAAEDGSTWFLAPRINCEELKDKVLPTSITPIGVDTLEEAYSAIQAIAAGKGDTLTTCPHR